MLIELYDAGGGTADVAFIQLETGPDEKTAVIPLIQLELLGLEYRFVAHFLQGRINNFNDLRQKLASAICGSSR